MPRVRTFPDVGRGLKLSSSDSLGMMDRQMSDKLIISIGGWATVQAEGVFALGAALLIAVYLGALWFAAQRHASSKKRILDRQGGTQ